MARLELYSSFQTSCKFSAVMRKPTKAHQSNQHTHIQTPLLKMESAKKPVIFTDKEQIREWSRAKKAQGNTIALVPTMGYLHGGHLSLIKEAQKHANVIVVSIYVNPGQYSPLDNISNYPTDFNGGVLKLVSVPSGVDAVFHPRTLYDYKTDSKNKDVVIDRNGNTGKTVEGKQLVSCIEESGTGHGTWVTVEKLEKGMCGKSRPLFFRGVATLVTKLFHIVDPDVATFGTKNYQRWRIIQRMVTDLDFNVRIIGCEIIRDSNGLALSSRNVHLVEEDKETALSINKSLFEAKAAVLKGPINRGELRDLVTRVITEAGGIVIYVENCIRFYSAKMPFH